MSDQRAGDGEVKADANGTRYVDDGFGNTWLMCHAADCDLHVVRPGKVQCNGHCDWHDAEDDNLGVIVYSDEEMERIRARSRRLKEANDKNHRRAVNAERDVARLRARHDEKNAEAHAKHSLLGELIDALSDDLAYEISKSPTVAGVVRRAIVAMDDDRYRGYLDAWWLS